MRTLRRLFPAIAMLIVMVVLSTRVQDVRGLWIAAILAFVVVAHAVRGWQGAGEIFVFPLERLTRHEAAQLARPEARWERMLDAFTIALLVAGAGVGLQRGWVLTDRVGGALAGAAVAGATLLVLLGVLACLAALVSLLHARRTST